MNDALISGSVDFVCLGIPGLITVWSKTKGTIDVKDIVYFLSIIFLGLFATNRAVEAHRWS